MSETRTELPPPRSASGSLAGLFPEENSSTRKEGAPAPRNAKKKRRRGVIPIVVILVIIALVAVFLLRPRPSATSGLLTSTAGARTVSLTAQGTGTVVDGETIAIATDDTWTMTERDGVSLGTTASQAAPVTVATVKVQVGSRVFKGKILAKVKNADDSITTIKSPVSGYVRASSAVKNSTVSGSLFTIGGGALHVSVPVSEYDIGKVAVGQTVSLDLQGLGQTKTSEVVSTSPVTADSSTSSTASGSSTAVTDYNVVVTVPDPGTAVRVGMNAQATIQIQHTDAAIAIPIQAISTNPSGKSTVKIVDARGREQSQVVTLGLVGDTYAEVNSGLTEGEKVVTGSAASSTTTTTVTPGGRLG